MSIKDYSLEIAIYKADVKAFNNLLDHLIEGLPSGNKPKPSDYECLLFCIKNITSSMERNLQGDEENV